MVDRDAGSTPPDSTLAEGLRVGPYEIEDEIGRGGMGIVYRARHRVLQHAVALKVLHRAAGTPPDLVHRFVREARVIAHLDHPGIVRLREWGEDGELLWFAMDHVQGMDLDRYVEAIPCSPEDLALILESVARAVHAAHERGVVHRDLKPTNVRIDERGEVRVLDFGVARVLGEEGLNLTQTGQRVGTPRYMSPEQCLGAKSRVDRRSDVFSMGVILYELLAGRPPFEAESAFDLYRRIVEVDAAPLAQLRPELPEALVGIVAKAMAKRPEDRHASALDLAQALRGFLEGRGAVP